MSIEYLWLRTVPKYLLLFGGLIMDVLNDVTGNKHYLTRLQGTNLKAPNNCKKLTYSFVTMDLCINS